MEDLIKESVLLEEELNALKDDSVSRIITNVDDYVSEWFCFYHDVIVAWV